MRPAITMLTEVKGAAASVVAVGIDQKAHQRPFEAMRATGARISAPIGQKA